MAYIYVHLLYAVHGALILNSDPFAWGSHFISYRKGLVGLELTPPSQYKMVAQAERYGFKTSGPWGWINPAAGHYQ